MRVYVPQTPEEIAQITWWVAAQIPHLNGEGFGPCTSLGVLNRDGILVAGLVFHGSQPQYGNIQISMAATDKRWPTRQVMSGLLAYPFTQLGVQRVTVITPPGETSVWRFLAQFGFQREGRVRKGLGTEDAVIWGLLASEWRTHRYNVQREDKPKRRRRRRGTLTLEGHTLQ